MSDKVCSLYEGETEQTPKQLHHLKTQFNGKWMTSFRNNDIWPETFISITDQSSFCTAFQQN